MTLQIQNMPILKTHEIFENFRYFESKNYVWVDLNSFRKLPHAEDGRLQDKYQTEEIDF